jgi:hypothetical protein
VRRIKNRLRLAPKVFTFQAFSTHRLTKAETNC